MAKQRHTALHGKFTFIIAGADPASEHVIFSEKENVVEMGEDLMLFCNPQDDSLTVWWTAETHDGARMEIQKGKVKYVVSKLCTVFLAHKRQSTHAD